MNVADEELLDALARAFTPESDRLPLHRTWDAHGVPATPLPRRSWRPQGTWRAGLVPAIGAAVVAVGAIALSEPFASPGPTHARMVLLAHVRTAENQLEHALHTGDRTEIERSLVDLKLAIVALPESQEQQIEAEAGRLLAQAEEDVIGTPQSEPSTPSAPPLPSPAPNSQDNSGELSGTAQQGSTTTSTPMESASTGTTSGDTTTTTEVNSGSP